MKNMREFEVKLLEGGESLKKSGLELVGNVGKLVAILCVLITAVVTFTDVSFTEFNLSDTLPQLILLLTSSYVIYFSLEDAGERLGEDSEEYKAQRARHTALCEGLSGEDTRALGKFLEDYCTEELESRRRRMLGFYGLSDDEFRGFLSGKETDKRRARILKRVARLRPSQITLTNLLSSLAPRERRGPLENPTRRKLASLILKLIPSTVCTAVTVSVMLTVKGDMTASDVLSALLKLSALPIIGFRGYAAGYAFSKNDACLWYRIRSDIIEEYIERKKQKTLD